MAGNDELDAGLTQRFDDVEILFARHSEYPLDTLILQSAYQEVGALHGVHSSRLLHVDIFIAASHCSDMLFPSTLTCCS